MAARLGDVKRALAKFGVTVVEPRKGSHWKASAAGKLSYSLTAHNGLKSEIPDVYLRGVCRNFDIDFDAFLKEL